MADDFDPYYQWLGIPPKHQPPNHYRLLALEEFESNLDVIENAADQRMAHVRMFQSGPHGEVSQRLLNEITAAKLCLLNLGKKAEYDQKLRAEKDAAEPRRLKPLPRLVPTVAPTEVYRIASDVPSAVPSAGQPRAGRRLSPHQAAMAGAGLGVLLVAVLAYVMLSRIDWKGGAGLIARNPDDTQTVEATNENSGQPASGAKVEPGASLPVGVWCDVLPWVDVALDAGAGKWQSQNGELEVAQSANGKALTLPVVLEGDYRLAVEFSCLSPGIVEFLIPVADRGCNAEVGGRTGLFWIDGRHTRDIGTGTDQKPLALGQRHRAEIEVACAAADKARIHVAVGGTTHIEWQGNPASLSGWQTGAGHRPAIGGWDAQVRFHRVQVQLVSGKATRLARPGTTGVNTAEGAAREFVWIDDAPPPGVQLLGTWEWVTKPQPVFSGEKSMRRSGAAISEHFFMGANPRFDIGEGDRLFAYVYLDPQDPPKTIMLQVNDSNHPPNLAERYRRAYWGEDLIPYGEANTTGRRPMGALPKTGEWVRLEVAAEELGLAPGAQVHLWGATQFGGTAYWDRAGVLTRNPPDGDTATPKAPATIDQVWIEDGLPPGSAPQGGSKWDFVGDPHPVYSGQKSLRQTAGQSYFNTSNVLVIGEGDRLFTYVYIDPKDPPKTLLLEFHSGNWEHRAFWGEDLDNRGVTNTSSRRPMGKLPKAGQWVRLEIPVELVGLNHGTVVGGWTFAQHGGTAYWDRAGIAKRAPPPEKPRPTRKPAEIAGESVFLDESQEEEAKIGYGRLGRQGQRGTVPHDVVYQGRKVPHALVTIPASRDSAYVVYQLNGAFATFCATAALLDVPDSTLAASALTFKALGDGKLLWQSSPVQRLGTGQPLVVNVEGVKTLKLEIHCPAGFECAHAAWLMPIVDRAPRTAQPEGTFLDDLKEKEFKVGHGTLGKRGYGGHPTLPEAIFQGVKVPHALVTHPASRDTAHVVYELKGEFKSFRATAGLLEVPKETQAGTALTFKVYGDGKLLWQSAPIQRLGTGQGVVVDIEGVKTLKLEVQCPGPWDFAWATWINPLLSKLPASSLAPTPGQPGSGITSLTNAAVRFKVPEEHYAVIRGGDVEAVIVDNEAVDNDVLKDHRLGYHGVGSLTHKARPVNLFVPTYCGLHLASIYDGTNRTPDVSFEPRRSPMELRVVSERIVELYQKPTPTWGLEIAIRYELLDDGVMEVTCECIPRKRTFAKGYIGLYFPSYLNRAESQGIHFLGHDDSRPSTADWIRAVSPAHAQFSTHLAAGDRREFPRDADFPIPVAVNHSIHRYDEPWFYGVSHGMAFVQMFRGEDQVRFTQSPIGGEPANSEWSFNWLIPNYEVGKLYRLVMRAMYVPFDSLHVGLIQPHLWQLNGGAASSKPPPKIAFLDDLTEVEFKVGHGTLGKRGERGVAGPGVPGGNVSFQGRPFAHAVCTHPATGRPAYVVYNLGGEFSCFRALAALSDLAGVAVRTPVVFKAIADGKLVWTSVPIDRAGAGQICALDIRSVRALRLEVHSAGDEALQIAGWMNPLVSTIAEPPLPPFSRETQWVVEGAEFKISETEKGAFLELMPGNKLYSKIQIALTKSGTSWGGTGDLYFRSSPGRRYEARVEIPSEDLFSGRTLRVRTICPDAAMRTKLADTTSTWTKKE